MEINNTNIIEYGKGLNTDTSPQNQPKGTQRFALNAVNESELGDFPFPSNEESNEECVSFPTGYTPIGKEYMTEGKTIVFLVKNDETVSEIGIYDDKCKYQTHVNDALSPIQDKLNFKLSKQIDATYRLRRGCERTVYFTDDYSKPRYYNFDKAQDFKDSVTGQWSSFKFNLFKTYNKVPKFDRIEVEEQGGQLPPGSYNVSIQYLDEDFNPSEWISTTNPINIYNDAKTNKFLNIRGSINSDTEILKFPITTKAIKVTLSNLDDSYPFYRLAFIEANKGNGQVSAIKYTDSISIKQNVFIYTGVNALVKGTEAELAAFNDVINKAQSIEQLENRLIFGNTQGKQVDFCKLQRYASRIKADCISKKVYHNNIFDDSNTKNPTTHFGDMLTGGTGYMPGEIYSFGIVYVFEDGSLSPTYHIPGKSNTIDPLTIYAPDPTNTQIKTYPMASKKTDATSNVISLNTCVSKKYIDTNNCSIGNYWGLDSEGLTLENTPIRHHRFPLRSALNVKLVDEDTSTANTNNFFVCRLKINGTINLPCTQAMITAGDCTTLQVANPFQVRVTFTVNGIVTYLIKQIVPSDYNSSTGTYNLNLTIDSSKYTSNTIIVTSVEEIDGVTATIVAPGSTSPKGLKYVTSTESSIETLEGKKYFSEIFGIKFSGVDLPSLNDTNGEKIIGYYIVRNERKQEDKTILDSAVLVPTVVNSKYIAHGLLAPDSDRLSKDVYGIIHPEHKFNNNEILSYTEIIQEGNFDIESTTYGKSLTNDVRDGSTYNSDDHKGGSGDDDGWSLKIISRDSRVKYSPKASFTIPKSKVKENFYLRAVESRDINEGANTVYNITSDNRIGIIQTTDSTTINTTNQANNKLPYVLYKRDISDPYSNFRTLPYYKESINMQSFASNTALIFNGDTYVTPMRYVNTLFWNNRPAVRVQKGSSSSNSDDDSAEGGPCGCDGLSGFFANIVGAVIIVAAVAFAVLTLGAGTALSVAAIAAVVGGSLLVAGIGATLVSSGIKQDEFEKAYFDEYNKGLRETALDAWTGLPYTGYGQVWNSCGGTYVSPEDDEIQWIGDCITDLWFESTINLSLRNKLTSETPTFIDAPGIIENGNNYDEKAGQQFLKEYYCQKFHIVRASEPTTILEKHLDRKLLFFNSKRKANKELYGLALGEYYNVNPDFHRFNKQKLYYALGEEYDCCSDCKEDFPHRVHYSEQSFQEELTDNYRVFLPNNYRDIEGETGEIKNIFRIGNNLFIHTLEALWQMPRSYQERVTDQIVSFIGTGSYFEVPPQKILDDDTGNSAGTQHKWSRIKTPHGYFFICENQNSFMKFDGQKLEAISNNGMYDWFFRNLPLKANQQYYLSNFKNYLYNDNVSNPIGTGFITTYDSQKERLLLTKKDFLLGDGLTNSNGYELCYNNGVTTIFQNYQDTINFYNSQGWNYLGLDTCRMKFSRDVKKIRQEIRYKTVNIFADVDYLVFRYTFLDGRDLDTRTTLLQPFVGSPLGWCQNNPNNSIMSWAGDNTGTGNEAILIDVKNQKILYPSNTDIRFNSKAWWFGPIGSGIVRMSAEGYKGGTMSINNFNFINTGGVLKGTYNFSNVFIPFAGQGSCNPNPTNIGNFNYNILRGELSWDGVIGGEIPSTTEIVQEIVDVEYIDTEFLFVNGEPIDTKKANASWTMSYSFKTNSWTSFHSYMPDFYINTPQHFFSWIPNQTINNVWKHNILGKYQTFYNKLHQFIVEYVSVLNPISNNITDSITIFSEAKKYDKLLKEFVDENDIFFNKLIAYNSRQCSGLMNIKVKNTDTDYDDYLLQQVQNIDNNIIIADRDERDWNINELRDIRVDNTKPIWNSDLISIQNEYFIDKILNNSSINYDKDWTQLESFRDKYLVVRFIFDNFADIITKSNNVKLLMNYSAQNETQSFR